MHDLLDTIKTGDYRLASAFVVIATFVLWAFWDVIPGLSKSTGDTLSEWLGYLFDEQPWTLMALMHLIGHWALTEHAAGAVFRSWSGALFAAAFYGGCALAWNLGIRRVWPSLEVGFWVKYAIIALWPWVGFFFWRMSPQ